MAATPKDDPNALSFEAHLGALEGVVSDLEGDALSLEASIERYRVGVDHLSACRRILDGAEKRLAELVRRADGSGAEERPLVVGADGLVDAGEASPGGVGRSTGSGEATTAVESVKKSAARSPRKPSPPASGGGDGDIPF